MTWRYRLEPHVKNVLNATLFVVLSVIALHFISLTLLNLKQQQQQTTENQWDFPPPKIPQQYKDDNNNNNNEPLRISEISLPPKYHDNRKTTTTTATNHWESVRSPSPQKYNNNNIKTTTNKQEVEETVYKLPFLYFICASIQWQWKNVVQDALSLAPRKQILKNNRYSTSVSSGRLRSM